MPVHDSAVWTLRIYGVLAVVHLLVQYRYALGHQWRLKKQLLPAVTHRMYLRPTTMFCHRHPRHAALASRQAAREQFQKLQAAPSPSAQPEPAPRSAAVWITVYQETPELLRACLESLVTQTFRGRLKVFVSDDGSYLCQIAKYLQTPAPGPYRSQKPWPWMRQPKAGAHAEHLSHFLKKRQDLLAVFDEFRADHRFEFILADRNAGKREAQKKAWLQSYHSEFISVAPGKTERRRKRYDLYISVDSDTVLDRHAIATLVRNFRNPELAAVTGYVDVGNAEHNFLTRLIDMRYWSAFHVERAAQSYHQAVMCCSGPLAAYRSSVVDLVMEKYTTQKFLGKYCTFGDDRHMTNLILTLGHQVTMDPRAHCLTEVPTDIKQYIRQQTRWNKSFYREMLWTISAISSHSWYMAYDLLMQFALPFLLIAALVSTAVIAATGGGPRTIVLYLLSIVVVGLIRSLYGTFMRRQLSYLLFFTYGFIYVCVLIPVRFYALVTLFLGYTQWGTRD